MALDRQTEVPDEAAAEPERLNLLQLRLRTEPRGVKRFPTLLSAAIRLAWASAPGDLIAAAAFQLVSAVGVAAQVLITREVIFAILELDADSSVAPVVPWVLALVGIQGLIQVLGLLKAERQRIMGELVARRAIGEVLDTGAAVPLIRYEDPAFHDRLLRAQINAGSRPMQMVNGLLNVVGAVISAIGIAIALLVIAPLFVLFLLVAYVPLLLATRRASRFNYRFSVEQAERDRRLNYYLMTLMSREAAAENRAYGLGTAFRDRWAELFEQRLADLRTLARRRLWLGLVGGTTTALLNGMALVALVWFVADGRLAVADAGAAAAALLLLAQRLRGLAGGASSLYESSLFIADYLGFAAERVASEQRREAPAGTAPGGARAAAHPRPTGTGFERLEVNGLSFTYPSRTEPALDAVSFSIDEGQVVALVGENGSGKTTLTKLLAGLYTPPPGTVLWNGTDAAELPDSFVRDSVGVIFQNYGRYILSARENISVGRVDEPIDDQRLADAATKAAADRFLRELPKGYDTLLGAEYFGGSDLSGGQWQRVALARGFYRDAPFLILDEPTAALDPRSEAELFSRIRELYAGRTVLLISHRFSSVRDADHILVLDQGRLVEQGAHDELMQLDGLYAELFELQAKAYR